MRAWIFQNFEHFLCGMLLLSRVGDLTTTWLITPNLVLEANPVARKLRWRFGMLTLLVCFLPYWNTAIAWAALIMFLMVCASNARSIWLVRAFGEQTYYTDVLLVAARKGSFGAAAASLLGYAFFTGLVGSLMILMSEGSSTWSLWTGVGIVAYSIVVTIYHTLFLRRVFEAAKGATAA